METSGNKWLCTYTYILCMYVCIYINIYNIYEVSKHSDVYAYGGTVNILAILTVQPPNMYLRNKYLLNNVAAQQDVWGWTEKREFCKLIPQTSRIYSGWW